MRNILLLLAAVAVFAGFLMVTCSKSPTGGGGDGGLVVWNYVLAGDTLIRAC